MREIKVLYFAMLKDAIGRAQEQVALPPNVSTVADLMDFLSAKGEPYTSALANRKRVRAAVDQVMASPEASLATAQEVALFPPVTGG